MRYHDLLADLLAALFLLAAMGLVALTVVNVEYDRWPEEDA